MSRVTRLWVVLAINLVLIGVLAVVGWWANSLGVLAAAGDYLADSGAVVIALLAVWLASRPPSPRRPLGYARATTWAALVNALLLLGYEAVVVVQATRRLLEGAQEVDGLAVLVVSGSAAIAMVAAALVLRGDVEGDDDTEGDRANMRAVMLDTVADAAAAAGVAVTGAVIAVTGGWYWLDPTVALAIAVVIGYHVVLLLRDVVASLHASSRPTSSRQ
jgi:cobalt-zinc-cadmium efflux system protein